jgi:S-adenosylmethionine synthetase
MELVVGRIPAVAPDAEVEIVERKGLGHPDTICDAMAEEVSLALSKFFRERFGVVLHHNVDKILLRGGEARPAFGGGRVTRPIDIYLAGRAPKDVDTRDLPFGLANVIEHWRIELERQRHYLNLRPHLRVTSPDHTAAVSPRCGAQVGRRPDSWCQPLHGADADDRVRHRAVCLCRPSRQWFARSD